MAAPEGNQNRTQHGCRAVRSQYREGLTLGKLPPGCSWLRRKITRFRNALEQAVLDRVGVLGIVDVAIIQSAARWETHAELCRRWLTEGDLTPDQRLNFSRQVASASSERDRCLAKLPLASEHQEDPWDVLTTIPAEAAPEPPESECNGNGCEGGCKCQSRTEAKEGTA